MRKLVLTPIEEVCRIVATSRTKTQVLAHFGVPALRPNVLCLIGFLEYHRIPVPEYISRKISFTPRSSRVVPIPEDMFVENSRYKNIRNVMKRMGRMRKCEICDTSNWMGKRLSLQVDHINGINNDNRLQNLRCICPNCHSQTATFCGKNKKRPSWDDLYLELDP